MTVLCSPRALLLNLLWITLCSGPLACRPRNHDAMLRGVFEDSDLESLARHKGRQVVPSEASNQKAVLIAYETLTTLLVGEQAPGNMGTLAGAINNAGVELWIIRKKFAGSDEPETPAVQEFIQRLRNPTRFVSVDATEENEDFLWVRDYAPLGALTPEGELRLLDFNYMRQGPDRTARSMPGHNRISLPVEMDGGSFMVSDHGNCVISANMAFTNNFRPDGDAAPPASGVIQFSRDELKQLFTDYAGCRNVTFLEDANQELMPYEGTGHTDIWAKFLNGNDVLVSELPAHLLERVKRDFSPDDPYRRHIEEMAVFLDRQEDLFGSRLGMNVIRLPMPPPHDMGTMVLKLPDGQTVTLPGPHYKIMSYTNSIILNRQAIMPAYYRNPQPVGRFLEGRPVDYQATEYYAADMFPDLLRQAMAIYKKNGFEPYPIRTDLLAYGGGSIHCVMAQVPGSAGSARRDHINSLNLRGRSKQAIRKQGK